jgi:N-acetylmuramoyl-L-alanine amidase
MTFSGKYLTVALAVLVSGAGTLPTSASIAAPAPVQPAIDVSNIQIPEVPQAPAPAAIPAPVSEAAPAPAPAIAPAPAANPVDAPRARSAGITGTAEIDPELECLAKVVLHEAGNQSRTGQVAVAEVVMNRLQDPRGRFGRTICGVVLQRGQFFNVQAYNARRDPRWRTAVEVARAVRDGQHEEVTNGGLFFRTAYGAGFPGRTRVATIGAHAFYR